MFEVTNKEMALVAISNLNLAINYLDSYLSNSDEYKSQGKTQVIFHKAV